jgi:hypothetical protein
LCKLAEGKFKLWIGYGCKKRATIFYDHIQNIHTRGISSPELCVLGGVPSPHHQNVDLQTSPVVARGGNGETYLAEGKCSDLTKLVGDHSQKKKNRL